MVCWNCKKEYTGKFCPYCGESNVPSREKSGPWEPNRWQRALIYLGAAVAAVVCWFGVRSFLY